MMMKVKRTTHPKKKKIRRSCKSLVAFSFLDVAVVASADPRFVEALHNYYKVSKTTKTVMIKTYNIHNS